MLLASIHRPVTVLGWGRHKKVPADLEEWEFFTLPSDQTSKAPYK